MNTPKLSPMLTLDEMHQVLTDWHQHYADHLLYDHLQFSFEDMADQLWVAIKDMKSAHDDAQWMASKNLMPGFAETWAKLDALTILRPAP